MPEQRQQIEETALRVGQGCANAAQPLFAKRLKPSNDAAQFLAAKAAFLRLVDRRLAHRRIAGLSAVDGLLQIFQGAA